jgi:O-antigen/teichoic acid export membrane protein
VASADPATRGSAVRLATELLGRGFAFGATLLIARGLGPEAYGVFAVLSGVAWVAAEGSDLGLTGTAARTLAAGSWELGDLRRAKLVLSALIAGPALLVVATTHRPGLRALAALVLGMVAVSWTETLGVALRSARRPLAEAAVLLLARAGSLGAVALATGLGAGLAGYAYATALAPLPALLVATLLAARAYPAAGGPPRRVGALIREGLPVGLATALALVAYRVELWLLLPLRGGAETGLFGGALRVFDGLRLIPGAVAQGAMPYLVEEAQAARAPARERTVRSVVLLGVPAAIGVLALAPELVALLLGEAFARAVTPVRLLALAIVPAFLNTFLLQSLLAAGHAAEMPRLMALRLAASLGLGLLAIPTFGAAGGAATAALAELVVLVRGRRVAARRGLPLGLGAALREAAAPAALMAIVLTALPASAPLAAALGLAAYVGAVAHGRR